MANGMTTTSQIPAAQQEFYNRALLTRALARICHDKFGQVKPIPMNSGEQPKYRRYSSLTNAVQPLTEGVTPTPQQLSKTDVTGQLQQYGSYVELSDYAINTNQDALLTETATLLGENAGESLDIVYRDTLVGGSNVFQANGVAAITDIVTGQSVTDYKKIERALMKANAKMWKEKPIMGSDKVGTTPIAASFYAIVDEYAYYDLRALTGFVQVHEYPDGGASAMDGEIGSLGHIRFIMTTNAKVWANGGGDVGSTGLASTGASKVDVHCALIFGQDAYGITPLSGKAMEMINKGLGEGNDPMNQRATSAWKATTDIQILNDDFMYRYQFGVTA